MRLMALIAFGGDCRDCDFDAAAEALRAAGYDVYRMPAVHPKLGHPLDDHIEAFIEGPPGAPPIDPPSEVEEKVVTVVMDEVERLVDRFGGYLRACAKAPRASISPAMPPAPCLPTMRRGPSIVSSPSRRSASSREPILPRSPCRCRRRRRWS